MPGLKIMLQYVITLGVLIISNSIPLYAAQKVKVVTTTMDLKALVEAVGMQKVEVTSLTRGYEDPHFVEAKPSLMIKLQKADLLVKVGLDLETGWLPVLIEGAHNPGILAGAPGHIDASVGVNVLEIPTGKVDRSLGDIHLLGNPHFWLDPENARVVVSNIVAGLKTVAPGDKDFFEVNAGVFLDQLSEAMLRWESMLTPYRGAKVVTYHNSWSYFARRFGLEVVGYIEPKPGIPASPAHIARLIAIIKQEKVKVIIMEPYFSEKIPQMIARQTGAKVLILPPSVGGAKGVDSYLSLFDHNLNQIASALKGGA